MQSFSVSFEEASFFLLQSKSNIIFTEKRNICFIYYSENIIFQCIFLGNTWFVLKQPDSIRNKHPVKKQISPPFSVVSTKSTNFSKKRFIKSKAFTKTVRHHVKQDSSIKKNKENKVP